jgi:thiamine pyrophosphate-dependent acetolactate synthase large subunit-like protein
MTAGFMEVSEATEVLVEERGDAVGVVTMSALAWWGEPRPTDYRLVGLMGSAGAVGMGIALGAPDRRVWVVDGDGSVLMQLGILPAIAAARVPNLTHILIDNGIYAVSGAQAVTRPKDWRLTMEGFGFADVRVVTTTDELRAALRADAEGPRSIVIRCRNDRPAYPPGAFAIVPAQEAARVRAAFTGSSSAG